jgi:hypothetical protein
MEFMAQIIQQETGQGLGLSLGEYPRRCEISATLNTMDIESFLNPFLLNWSEIARILGAAGKYESARNSSSLPTNYPCHLL